MQVCQYEGERLQGSHTADVCRSWHNGIAPMLPLPMQHSTSAFLKAANTVCTSQERPNRPSSEPNRTTGTPYTRRNAEQRPTNVEAADQVL